MTARVGLSPLMSTAILVAIVLAIATSVGPWMIDIVTSVTNSTATTSDTEMTCQNTAYDFDTDYGTFGATWNFTGTSDSLSVKVINTGNVNLYNFSLELELNRTIGSPRIMYLEINSSTQRTPMNPLKPGQTAVLDAAMDQDINGTLTKLKVTNPVCPRLYVSQEF